MADTLAGGAVQYTCQLWQATKLGACLMVLLLTVNVIELGAQKCRNALFLRYGIDLPDLSKYFEKCNAAFSIFHALD